MSNADTMPFTHTVHVRRLPKKGHHEKYSAPEDVRALISARYDLMSVEKFDANALVAPWKRDGVKVSGEVKASLTQPCAVTGDPLQVTLHEEVDVILVPDGSKLARPPRNDEGELIFDVEGDDLPVVFVGDTIDLGDIWLEFFALGLNPYARTDGAEFNAGGINTPEESPFSALATLKSAMKKQ